MSRRLCAFSTEDEEWVEIEVIFVDDLDENWISEDLVKRLGLFITSRLYVQEWCHLETRSLPFLGNVELQWSEKDGKSHVRSHFADCKVVRNKSFEVFLTMSLLPEIDPKLLNVEVMFTPDLGSILSPFAQADDTFISAQSTVEMTPAGFFDGGSDACKEDSPEYVFKLITK